MTEILVNIPDVKKQFQAQVNYYNRRLHNDEEFYTKEKLRVAKYRTNRYNTDDEYKEKNKEYMRSYMKEYYQKQKLKKSQNTAE